MNNHRLSNETKFELLASRNSYNENLHVLLFRQITSIRYKTYYY